MPSTVTRAPAGIDVTVIAGDSMTVGVGVTPLPGASTIGGVGVTLVAGDSTTVGIATGEEGAGAVSRWPLNGWSSPEIGMVTGTAV